MMSLFFSRSVCIVILFDSFASYVIPYRIYVSIYFLKYLIISLLLRNYISEDVTNYQVSGPRNSLYYVMEQRNSLWGIFQHTRTRINLQKSFPKSTLWESNLGSPNPPLAFQTVRQPRPWYNVTNVIIICYFENII